MSSDDDASGMKVHSVKQKRIVAKAVLLPVLSARYRDSLECISDLFSVFVSMCVLIKLHITTQFASVILVVL